MQYKELQALVKEHLRCARSLCYLLTKPAFREAYDRSEHKKILVKCIVEHDYVGVRLWWKRESLVDVYQLTVKDLRQLASFYQIPDYHLLRKWELQDEILHARRSTDIALRDDIFCDESSETGSLVSSENSDPEFDFTSYLQSFVRDSRDVVSNSEGHLDTTTHDGGSVE